VGVCGKQTRFSDIMRLCLGSLLSGAGSLGSSRCRGGLAHGISLDFLDFQLFGGEPHFTTLCLDGAIDFAREKLYMQSLALSRRSIDFHGDSSFSWPSVR
jgi:hypothetical protein